MPRTRITVSESYRTLGLPNGADIEDVKKSYKKLALQYHPDKAAPEISKEEATVKFQEIGEAYSVLKKHLEGPKRSNHPHPGSGHGLFGFGSDDDIDGESDYDDDFFEGSDYEDEMERMAFFMHLFDSIFGDSRNSRCHNPNHNHHHHHHHRHREPPFVVRGPGGFYVFTPPHGPAPRREPIPEESAEQRQARIERERREREEAAARREQEAKLRKERRDKERAAQAEAAAAKKKDKARARKEAHEASQNHAAQKAQEVLTRRQSTRSKVFEAARQGNSAAVKKGVWEDQVDAAGGEQLKGAEDYVTGKSPSWDKLETLLHIAVSKEDKQLAEWLVNHNAEPDERDSQGHTAFNRALTVGDMTLINYFLTNFDPEDEDSLPALRAPKTGSNLQLAAMSGKVGVVRKVIEVGLVDVADVAPVWDWVGQQERGKKAASKTEWAVIKDVLKQIDGWQPAASDPATPNVKEAPEARPNTNPQRNPKSKPKKNRGASIASEPQAPVSPSAASAAFPPNQSYKRQHHPSGSQPSAHSRQTSYSQPQHPSSWHAEQNNQNVNQGAAQPSSGGRGRGAPRGRGGRGRGRGGPGPRGDSFKATATAY